MRKFRLFIILLVILFSVSTAYGGDPWRKQLDWQVKSSAYTAHPGDCLLVDTSAGTVTITLPSSPKTGDEVLIADSEGTFNSNNCTVARNGNDIRNAASNATLTTQYTLARFVYRDATYGWQYFEGTGSVSPALTGDVTISSTLGDELTPAMTAALWTEGTGWVIADGVATKTAGTGSTLAPTEAIVPVAGTNYKISFVLTRSAGSITMTFGGTLGTIREASGTYTSYVTAAAGTNLIFTADASFAGTVTTVTVKSVTAGSLSVEGEGSYASRIMLESGSAYAPAIVWDDANKLGIYRHGSQIIGFADSSNLRHYFNNAVHGIPSDTGRVVLGAADDLIFGRDAANAFAQRNAGTQQIFRIYNTADAFGTLTNYERLTLTGVAGTSLNITAETGGTGSDNLSIILTPAGTGTTQAVGNFSATTYASDASVTDAELKYINTLSSNAQDQFDSKQATVTEGSLPNLIVTGDIKDDTVGADDLAHVISKVNQEASVGDGGTLTPTAGYERVHIQLTATADPSAITLSETGAVDNVIIYIVNVGSNTATFADSSGVQELTAPATIEQYESITFKYEVDRWVEIARATNDLQFSTLTTVETEYIPIAYAIDGASAPDVLETITSDTDKVNVRTFQSAADEDVLFEWMVPQDIDAASGIKFRIVFYPTNATGPSSEVVVFEMAGFSLGDGDALNGTLGTVQTSTMAAATHAQYDRCTTAWSAAMTATHITNLSADGETIIFKLNRDSGIASDYEQLVGVSGIELKYKRLHDTTF